MRSHLLIAFMGAAAIAAVLFNLVSLGESASRSAELRGPTLMAISKIRQGIDRSDAAIRAQVVSNSQEMIDRRAKSWSMNILPALHDLKEIGALELRDLIIEKTDALSVAQWWAEDVAGTPGNQPAKAMRLLQISHVEKAASRASQAIVDFLVKDPNSVSKGVIVSLGKIIESFNLARADLSVCLDTGTYADEEKFRLSCQQMTRAAAEVVAKASEQPEQLQKLVARLGRETESFETLANEAIMIRSGDNWNLARSVLNEEIEPLTKDLRRLLDERTANQTQLWKEDVFLVSKYSEQAMYVGIVAFFAMLIVGAIFAMAQARKISQPVVELARSAEVFSQDTRVLIPISSTGIHEIDLLAGRLQAMQKQIRRNQEKELASQSRESQSVSRKLEEKCRETELFVEFLQSKIAVPVQNLILISDRLRNNPAINLSSLTTDELSRLGDDARQMQSQIKDILDLHCVESRDLDFDKVPLDRCVDRALSELSAEMGARGVSFQRCNLPVIKGDRDIWNRVLEDLIRDALNRASAKGVVQMGSRSDGDVVTVSIQDDGVNMDAGVDLRMAVASKGVERHGGKILMESIPGGGTQVTFTIPMTRVVFEDVSAIPVSRIPKRLGSSRPIPT